MNKTMTLSFKTNPRQTNIRHNNANQRKRAQQRRSQAYSARKSKIQYPDFQNAILKMFIMICLMMR